jgi:hypothetical protein
MAMVSRNSEMTQPFTLNGVSGTFTYGSSDNLYYFETDYNQYSQIFNNNEINFKVQKYQ